MDVVFVGAGRLATNLAKALTAQGHRVVGVYSRTMASAKLLSDIVGGHPTDDIDRLPLKADVFIVAVKDSAMPKVTAQLAQGRADQVLLHTAGSMSIAVFGEHRHAGVLYPMQTFSKERQVDFSRVHLFIEGTDEQALTAARTLAESVSPHVKVLCSEARRHLHLAAVFACNFSNHCYALSAQILEQYGLTFDAMLPLVDETAAKVHSMRPVEAQTGPAIRYDENVIQAQRALLAHNPSMQHIYDIMSESIHKTAYDSL